MELFWLAFVTGLVGSLHCAGMCGPIAFSLPFNPEAKSGFYLGRILYNSGRLLSYATLGVLTGAFGSALGFAGLQQELGIIAGSLLILTVLLTFLQKNRSVPILDRLSQRIRKGFHALYGTGKNSSLLGIGILNGFLPCGLVYTALAISLAAGTPLKGAAVMVLFGAGTFPMMFILSVSRRFVSLNVWRGFAKWSPFFALLIGVIFILRGANLGIPFLSPKIEPDKEAVECCSEADHAH